MIEEIEIELPIIVKVKFEAFKAEPRTRHYPGDPAHIELLDVTIPTTDEIVKEFEDEIEQECWDLLGEMAQEAAERKYDEMRER